MPPPPFSRGVACARMSPSPQRQSHCRRWPVAASGRVASRCPPRAVSPWAGRRGRLIFWLAAQAALPTATGGGGDALRVLGRATCCSGGGAGPPPLAGCQAAAASPEACSTLLPPPREMARTGLDRDKWDQARSGGPAGPGQVGPGWTGWTGQRKPLPCTPKGMARRPSLGRRRWGRGGQAD